jgi:hypothetical protein
MVIGDEIEVEEKGAWATASSPVTTTYGDHMVATMPARAPPVGSGLSSAWLSMGRVWIGGRVVAVSGGGFL